MKDDVLSEKDFAYVLAQSHDHRRSPSTRHAARERLVESHCALAERLESAEEALWEIDSGTGDPADVIVSFHFAKYGGNDD
jgi:hypothetical protein